MPNDRPSGHQIRPSDSTKPVGRPVVPLFVRLVDRLCEGGAYAACACLAFMVVILCVEIMARAFSSESPFSTWEFSGYLQAGLVMLGAGYALRSGGHIRVNLILTHLGQAGARALDFVCSLIGFVAMAVISWALFELFSGSLQSGSRSYFVTATPLWVPQAVVFLGSVLLTLQFAARMVRIAVRLPAEQDAPTMAGFGAE